CGRTAEGCSLSGMLNVHSGCPAGRVSDSCALTSGATRNEASAHARTAVDVLARSVWRITAASPLLDEYWFYQRRRVVAMRITTSLRAARPEAVIESSSRQRLLTAVSGLIRQRAIHYSEEISDRALVHAELGVVVGGRPEDDDFLLGLAGSLELGDALAGLEERAAIIAQHRFGAGRAVARHDLG